MDFQALIASIPENQRDAFIEQLELAWKGCWLASVDVTVDDVGYRVMKAAHDFAEAADEAGTNMWLEEQI